MTQDRTVSIKGLDKADVLAALFNASRAQGMGFMQYNPTPITREQATALLTRTDYFDYLQGRIMKIKIAGEELDTWGYDRDNGPDCAAMAIQSLRETGDVNSPFIQQIHKHGILDATQDVSGRLAEGSSLRTEKGTATLNLGLSDVADKLEPRVRDAEDHHLSQ